MEIEMWVPIPGYEQYYECSSMGRVKRLSVIRPMISKVGKQTNRFYKERLLNPQKYTNEYFFICLSGETDSSQISLARLIEKVFVSNPENKTQINHKDGDISNNSSSNLEWNTPSENIIHSYRVLNRKIVRSGESRMGSLNKQSKPVQQFDLNGKLILEYGSAGEAARSISCSQSQMSYSCSNENVICHGFMFKYKIC